MVNNASQWAASNLCTWTWTVESTPQGWWLSVLAAIGPLVGRPMHRSCSWQPPRLAASYLLVTCPLCWRENPKMVLGGSVAKLERALWVTVKLQYPCTGVWWGYLWEYVEMSVWMRECKNPDLLYALPPTQKQPSGVLFLHYCRVSFMSKEIGGMAARIHTFLLNTVYKETLNLLNDSDISTCWIFWWEVGCVSL